MSQSEAQAAAYELRIDEHGAHITVRAAVSVDLFRSILETMQADPRFRSDMPSVWDARESAGFAALSDGELWKMVTISRRARSTGAPYRVALVTGRDADFGVGRMLGGAVSSSRAPELGVFRDLPEAERWAFGSHGP